MTKKGEKQDNHGLTGTRLYKIWENMKGRCMNTNRPDYKTFGGRGIEVCEQWLKFTGFFPWAFDYGYDDTKVLTRIDMNGPYSPKNCQWSTKAKSNRRRRYVKLSIIEARKIRRSYIKFSSTHGITALAKQYKVGQTTIRRILNNEIWKE